MAVATTTNTTRKAEYVRPATLCEFDEYFISPPPFTSMVYGLLPAEPACFVFLSSCRCSSNLGPTSGQNCLPTVSFTAVCRCDRISPFSGLESQHLDGPRAGMPAHQRRSSWTCDPIRAKLTAARLDFRLRSRQHYCITKVFCQGSELSNARALVSFRPCLTLLTKTPCAARPLRSTGVTPLPRYY